MEFDKFGFKQADLPKGQCSKVAFWEEKNFSGEPKEFSDFDAIQNFKGLGRLHPVTAIIMDLNPKSYIAYRKMRTIAGEKEIDEKLCEMLFKKDPKYCEGGFIKDDSCIVELYAEGPFWDKVSNEGCGDKLLSIPGAVANVERMLANPSDKISCYKIIPGDDE